MVLPDSIACFLIKLDLVFVNKPAGRGIFIFNGNEIDGQVQIVDGSFVRPNFTFQSRLNDCFILQ